MLLCCISAVMTSYDGNTAGSTKHWKKLLEEMQSLYCGHLVCCDVTVLCKESVFSLPVQVTVVQPPAFTLVMLLLCSSSQLNV